MIAWTDLFGNGLPCAGKQAELFPGFAPQIIAKPAPAPQRNIRKPWQVPDARDKRIEKQYDPEATERMF